MKILNKNYDTNEIFLGVFLFVLIIMSMNKSIPNDVQEILISFQGMFVSLILLLVFFLKFNSVIGISYFIHEIAHLSFGLSLYVFLGISSLSILVYLLFFIFYILLISDLNNFFLPYYLNLSISFIGLLLAFLGTPFHIETYGFIESSQIFISIYGFICGYGVLFFINFIYQIVNKVDGIGGGDFLLLGGIGTLVGPLSLSTIILLGSLLTLVIRYVNYDKYKQELPLGAGIIIGLFTYTICKFFELSLFGLVI